MTPAGRTPARRFQDLTIWQRGHQLVLSAYRSTADFPPTEKNGLTAQLRRAAVSVPANIAEGFRKRGRSDKARFFNIAEGSLEEVRYYLILADDLGYMDSRRMLTDVDELSRLLDAYCRKLLASGS